MRQADQARAPISPPSNPSLRSFKNSSRDCRRAGELAGTALGIIFATTLSLVFFLRSWINLTLGACVVGSGW
jgi:hypothetical protein